MHWDLQPDWTPGEVVELRHSTLDRFPPEWRTVATELRSKLDELAQERGPAFYGDEDAAIPASELFGESDARRALALVDGLLDLCGRLLSKGESCGSSGLRCPGLT